ncbi:MAG: FAD-dependent oxidoreductase [Elusimicrobia bacterium]|nr:FAD-dependent oxidoreductase [Elusimicrobiota bacterium]
MDFEAIVIGGGIVGAGIARDLALRGLKAVVLERGEPGRATTGSSTHLIHGGLRYLLYDRLTTHTTCWDSGHIVRIARPLLTRLPILWPVYRDHTHGAETVETLMETYDHFSGMKEGLPHLRLSAAETLKLVPDMKRSGLKCSLSFDEWWVDAAGLAKANLRAAADYGAELRTNTTVLRLLKNDRRVEGVETAGADGTRSEIRAPVTINAAGPWIDRVASTAGIRIPLRLQKGTHLIYERAILAPETHPPFGLLVEAEGGGRFVFLLHLRGQTWVGPTDLPAPENPDRVTTEPEEIRYLLASARRYFPKFPKEYDRTTVGARPILGQSGNQKLLSREFEILEHDARDGVSGLVTAAGGKMSDFRLMAQEAVDAACRVLGRPLTCTTHLRTLAGDPVGKIPEYPFPSRDVKRFLKTRPRLRELHALTYLAGAYAKHAAKILSGARRPATAAEFRRQYWP